MVKKSGKPTWNLQQLNKLCVQNILIFPFPIPVALLQIYVNSSVLLGLFSVTAAVSAAGKIDPIAYVLHLISVLTQNGRVNGYQ